MDGLTTRERDLRRHVRPHHTQPGTLRQQIVAAGLYRADPDTDRDAAWQRARETVIPHAVREE